MTILNQQNNLSGTGAEVRLFASEKTWIEGEALAQLRRAAEMPGMEFVVGLPDLHAGKGTPIGAAFFARARIYPGIIGGDVGCGMGLFQTGLRTRKCKRDRWTKRLRDLENPWEGNADGLLRSRGLSEWADALGTLGGGNHFAELQVVESVLDAEGFAALRLGKDELMLLIHSGSRGLGQAVLRRHRDQFGVGGIDADSRAAEHYLEAHNHAVAWARLNREVLARRFLDQIGGKANVVLDLCHNSVIPCRLNDRDGWLHRKGASPSDKGVAIIPGSRGSLSYLVSPVGDQSGNAFSIAHGAGRKWPRGECRKRLSHRYSHASLCQTDLGSTVICADRELIYAEAPPAYKNIEQVMAEMTSLVKVIATLRPVITYKTRRK